MTTATLNPTLDAATYHQRVLGVASNSALKEIARSPAHYRHWVESPEAEPTPAQRFGSLFHSYTLETAKTLQAVAFMPDFGDMRSSKNREKRDEWQAENAGRLIVDLDDWDRCRRMGDAVHRHPIAAKLIERAQAEVSVFWTDAATGLDCKARVDGWIPSMRIALDLKTTGDASPEGFAKAVADYDYHVQQAFYVDGLAASSGEPVRCFRFIAVEKTEPFAVAVYQLEDAAESRGRELYQARMATMKRCLDAGEWPAFGEETITLELPKWAYTRG